MTDQLDLFSSDYSEQWVFETLFTALKDTLQLNNAGENCIAVSEGKEYASVHFLKNDSFDPQKPAKKLLVFRICCRGGQRYISISDAFTHLVPQSIAMRIVPNKKGDGYSNYEFNCTTEDIMTFVPTLTAILDAVIDTIPHEFDCCSRFEECSNEKRCINPNTARAITCGYRKIMKRGRIYYGKNRNIG